MRKISFILLICFCFIFQTEAEIFSVTSNADAGAGTLRDALNKAAANGFIEKDYIHFNLPDLSEAGRTIKIQSQLPLVTSNIVIDGSTQPGSKFGRSDAKVILQPTDSYAVFSALVFLNADGLELYGLYVRDFIGDLPFRGSAALYLFGSKNVQVGAPGKGNVFANNYSIVSTASGYFGDKGTSTTTVENFAAYANFFEFEPDGKSYRAQPVNLVNGLVLNGCAGDVIIGGENANLRNFFGNSINPISIRTELPERNHPAFIKIINNYFNYNVDGDYSPLPKINTSSVGTITINNWGASSYYDLKYKVHIINNKIQAPFWAVINSITGEFVCQGNRVINEIYTNKASYSGGSLAVYSKDRILIGGEGSGEGNDLYDAAIIANSPKSLLIQHTSVYCAWGGVWALPWNEPKDKLPLINITEVTPGSVSGNATPLSKVELFWDDDCQTCQPIAYINTVMTDANGKWKYNGPITKGVIASATLNNYTSYFTTAAEITGSKITHYACGKNGQIHGLSFKHSGGQQWKDEKGTVLGTDTVLKNVSPGRYTLTTLNGTCSSNYIFNVYDATPRINEQYINISHPSCTAKGSIVGLSLYNGDVINDANSRGDYNAYSYKWLDASNKVMGNQIDLRNVDAGVYRLEVSYKNICTVSYGPVTLQNSLGPKIDESLVKLQPTICNQSTGSVTGLQFTGAGTLTYAWKNSLNQVVATTPQLTNQPAGLYTLKVTDANNCNPVSSSVFEIIETNGIILNDSKLTITNSTCVGNDGKIVGIIASGATKYEWRDAAGIVKGNNIDLTSVGPGTYFLTASNANCSKSTIKYTVEQQANLIDIGRYSTSFTEASCGLNNGTAEVILVNPVVLPKSYRWQNGTGETVGGDSLTLKNLNAGTYTLFGIDDNGCEKLLTSVTVVRIPILQFVTNRELITDDECSQKRGSIKNIQVNGGKTPYSYKWIDNNGKTLSTTINLTNVTEGEYELQVIDASGCSYISRRYTVINKSSSLISPIVNNVQLCSPGNALINITNAINGYRYKIYSEQNSIKPLNEQSSGKLNLNVSASKTYYVSSALGSCESYRVPFSIKVGVAAASIANTFSPNNDGINDYWTIKGIENYPNAIVQLYDRNGQKVFESRGHNEPFDGTVHNQPLPTGVYFYIINLGSGCSLFSGNLTLLR